MTGSFARGRRPPRSEGTDRSMNAPSLLLQRCGCGAAMATGGECSSCREGRTGMQRRRDRGGEDAFEGAEAPAIVGQALASPDRPLDEKTRAGDGEAGPGRDFRGVRVHADDRAADSAAAVGASAYAVGRHVVFGPGRYDPQSAAGRDLLAHELTHVAQQDGLRRPTPGSVRVAGSDSAREREAEEAGGGDATGEGSAPSSAVQRERGPDVRPRSFGSHHRGQLSLKLADPDTPPLRPNAVSLRATPAGLFELTTPRASTRLDAGQVPRVLRDAIRRGGKRPARASRSGSGCRPARPSRRRRRPAAPGVR